MKIEPASKKDAHSLARLINLAGEGIPEYLWSGMLEDDDKQSPLEIGAQRASREEGGFSYTHARVCREGNKLLGMAISYQQPDRFDLSDLYEYPELVQPLVKLEAKAPGSWYINAVAVYETARGKGVAKALINDAEQQGREAGTNEVSLIVASENRTAVKLYQTLGYQSKAIEAVIDYPGAMHGGEWWLMTKVL